jgi:hypothetical protein
MNALRSLLAAIGFVLAAAVSAAPITFIHSGMGSGTLDGVAFTNANFTIVALGDTDDRQAIPQGFFIDHLSASISISGVGLFSFVTGTRTFINDSSNTPGFSRAGVGGADLFNGPADLAFDGWDMLTSIVPIFGLMGLLQWTLADVVTSGGVLVFNDQNVQGSFEAIVGQAVPEPGTLLLAGLALLAFAASTRARRR